MRPAFSVSVPQRERGPQTAASREPSEEPAKPRRDRPRWQRVDPWRVAPVAVTALFALVVLVWAPRTVDLAAHQFRADLFGREGFTIWNGQWYGGHHTPAYSVLSPPLAWLLTPRLILALAAVGSAALFERLVRRAFGDAARWGAVFFGFGAATLLFTSRLPFALGVFFGLAAVLALQRRRRFLAPVMALLCTLSSPVAGLFLALAGVAYALVVRGREREAQVTDGGLVILAALVPSLFLTLAFPEGGYAAFPLSVYAPIPVVAVPAAALLWRRERMLAVGAVLYAAGATLALAVENPMGSNSGRLGALFAGPLLLCAAQTHWRRRSGALLAVGVVALAGWQWSAAVRDVVKYVEDPGAKRGYFEPLKQFLATLPDQRRIEIPYTRSHWEASDIAGDSQLARGSLRQLDRGTHPIFYRGPLSELTYASWLSENAVRYVALPSALPDSHSYAERALIERGLPYLRRRWSSSDWRVYEVTLPAPIVISRGGANVQLEQFGSDRLLLRVVRPGEALLRVRWTPYWHFEGGCVQRAGEWTRISARNRGFALLSIRFSPERVVQRGRRCAPAS
ncbi:MAG: hypothetical protein M3350_07180 [Actinomycetota bacterium]|nr:hypothetical protein [Actinomycetota bacterium]